MFISVKRTYNECFVEYVLISIEKANECITNATENRILLCTGLFFDILLMNTVCRFWLYITYIVLIPDHNSLYKLLYAFQYFKSVIRLLMWLECAVGDVHGDLDQTRYALEMAGVLSSDGQDLWTGGETVSLLILVIKRVL